MMHASNSANRETQDAPVEIGDYEVKRARFKALRNRIYRYFEEVDDYLKDQTVQLHSRMARQARDALYEAKWLDLPNTSSQLTEMQNGLETRRQKLQAEIEEKLKHTEEVIRNLDNAIRSARKAYQNMLIAEKIYFGPNESDINHTLWKLKRLLASDHSSNSSRWTSIRESIGVIGLLLAILVAIWTVTFGELGATQIIKPPLVVSRIEVYNDDIPLNLERPAIDVKYGQVVKLEIRAYDDEDYVLPAGDLRCDWTLAPLETQSEEEKRNAKLIYNDDCQVYYTPLMQCTRTTDCAQSVVVEIIGSRNRQEEIEPSPPTTIRFHISR